MRNKRTSVFLFIFTGIFLMNSSCFSYEFKKTIYSEPSDGQSNYMLVGNIGGTSIWLALVELHEKSFDIILVLKGSSKEVSNFSDIVSQAIKEIKQSYAIDLQYACFAVAGFISPERDYCNITNLPWEVDANKIIEQTSLKKLVLLNDFEAIGYGIEALCEDDLFCVNAGEKKEESLTKAVIGAGTGLGKCILAWDDFLKNYRVIPTEGGHADFAGNNFLDLMLINFISGELGGNLVVEWEHLLSGGGIQRIYRFLMQELVEKDENFSSPYRKEIENSNYDPKLIVQHQENDECCKLTMELFILYYGRCVKNFVFEVLPLGGIYLAGGIAQDNTNLFEDGTFLWEFYNNHRFGDLLKNIPVHIICNHNVELYGATLFGHRFIKI